MGTHLKSWLILVLLLGTLTYAIAEELTLTTYYPSPRGVYQELRIGGDAAIGTLETPGARLEIIGSGATAATSALRIKNVDQAPLLEVQNGGNVGVGTTSPTQKLDVQGGDINTSGKVRENGNVLVPAGTVWFFNLPTCPAGWNELTNARGRYLVGLPASGTLAATVGTALSNTENRPVGRHTHSATQPPHTHDYYADGPDAATTGWVIYANPNNAPTPYPLQTSPAQPPVTVEPTGSVDGTTAPYIQLLACQKN